MTKFIDTLIDMVVKFEGPITSSYLSQEELNSQKKYPIKKVYHVTKDKHGNLKKARLK